MVSFELHCFTVKPITGKHNLATVAVNSCSNCFKFLFFLEKKKACEKNTTMLQRHLNYPSSVTVLGPPWQGDIFDSGQEWRLKKLYLWTTVSFSTSEKNSQGLPRSVSGILNMPIYFLGLHIFYSHHCAVGASAQSILEI